MHRRHAEPAPGSNQQSRHGTENRLIRHFFSPADIAVDQADISKNEQYGIYCRKILLNIKGEKCETDSGNARRADDHDWLSWFGDGDAVR